ncbi:MAG TPA: 3-dehydroquinate synthase [Myxococcota bacterium]|nr:3-dehydroquinate synthase [Myxococcota bacterium]
MPAVPIALPHHRYDVVIEPGALERLGAQLRAVAPAPSALLVFDRAIERTHAPPARASLERAGYAAVSVPFEGGEEHKTLDTVRALYDVLLAHRFERRSPLVALGGGVLGDTVGFVAATFLRGVPFAQCPTTLLAMVDSSVGGKVGVNVPQGKNLIGAFHQPVSVVADPRVLRTLPARELRCGLAECIKHALIRDPALFAWTRAQMSQLLALDEAALVELVARNVAIKAAVVIEDEKETGVRAHLNLGHTFGHAIEAASGYGRILHGEAVALGLLAAAALAEELGVAARGLRAEIEEVVASAGLPCAAELPDDARLEEAMALDKKVAAGKIRFVLPERVGSVVIRDGISPAAVRAAFRSVRAGAREARGSALPGV